MSKVASSCPSCCHSNKNDLDVGDVGEKAPFALLPLMSLDLSQDAPELTLDKSVVIQVSGQKEVLSETLTIFLFKSKLSVFALSRLQGPRI